MSANDDTRLITGQLPKCCVGELQFVSEKKEIIKRNKIMLNIQRINTNISVYKHLLIAISQNILFKITELKS